MFTIIKMIKTKETCPVCRKKDMCTYWCEDHSDEKDYYDNVPMHRVGQVNGFFLCHHCGYFVREYDCRPPIEGISFDSKEIPSARQKRLLKKYYHNTVHIPFCDYHQFQPRHIKEYEAYSGASFIFE